MRDRHRALLAALAAGAIALTGVACGDDGDGGGESAGKPGEDVSIGFSTIVLSDQFFVRLNDGAKAAADRLGADLNIQNPNGDPVAQATQVENFIQQGVDAVMVDPIDPNGIVPALKQAKAQDIAVVAVDEVMAGVPEVSASSGNDNRAVGRKLGERLVQEVEKSGKQARVGVVMTVDAPIENARLAGFREAIKGNPDIKIVGRVDAKFSLDKAASGAENLITSDPELNWFYATGGIYGTGIASAIKSQDKQGDINLVGWDLSKQLIEAMKDGTYVLAAEQDAEKMGATAVEVAVKLANGEQVPRFNTVPVTYVTKANVDQFVERYPK